MGVFLRWLFAFLLLGLTYNPTSWNYVRWTFYNHQSQLSLAVFLGLLLLIGYIILFRATLRSIGGFGMLTILTLVASLLWVLHDFGLLHLDNTTADVWLGLLALSALLTIGLSWGHVRERLTGPVEVDDAETNQYEA
ncbi:DUF6524 family protein [Lutimaribacter marinistellae]|uniref:DUF6524 family protein n=1 Tax=Lutimaribacter marinistellae TaxID=1820329 RepID=A0ABV7TNT3_9RHOB